MARRRFQKRRPDTSTKRLRVNERIRVSPVRLIDEDNNQVGIVDVEDAQRRARAVELDLVEVAPQAEPPVCRIMDYGKWMYQQRKKEQKAKAHAKQSELKEVRLRPGTDDHDLQIKTERARSFFEDGDRVQFTILFRGRQMAHRDIGFRMFEDIAGQFADSAHVEMSPRVQGRRMTMTMAPGAKSGGKGDKGEGGQEKSSGGGGSAEGQAAAKRTPEAARSS